MKYKQVYDDVPYTIDPEKEIDTHGCCDCGLVHDIIYVINKNNKILITKKRNNRSTGQMRRWIKKKSRKVNV